MGDSQERLPRRFCYRRTDRFSYHVRCISQISNKRIDKPQDELNIGDTVKVMITAIDFEKKHVSLSIRALLAPEETSADVKEAVVEDDEPVAVSIDDLLAQAEAEKAGE